jgi:hypothetical protein
LDGQPLDRPAVAGVGHRSGRAPRRPLASSGPHRRSGWRGRSHQHQLDRDGGHDVRLHRTSPSRRRVGPEPGVHATAGLDRLPGVCVRRATDSGRRRIVRVHGGGATGGLPGRLVLLESTGTATHGYLTFSIELPQGRSAVVHGIYTIPRSRHQGRSAIPAMHATSLGIGTRSSCWGTRPVPAGRHPRHHRGPPRLLRDAEVWPHVSIASTADRLLRVLRRIPVRVGPHPQVAYYGGSGRGAVDRGSTRRAARSCRSRLPACTVTRTASLGVAARGFAAALGRTEPDRGARDRHRADHGSTATPARALTPIGLETPTLGDLAHRRGRSARCVRFGMVDDDTSSGPRRPRGTGPRERQRGGGR